KIFDLLMFVVSRINLGCPTNEHDVPHRRIKHFLFRLSMSHDLVPDLLEQSFPDGAVDFRRHLQRHDEPAHHPMIFLQDRGHPHRPPLDDWNQRDQRSSPGNRASDDSPLCFGHKDTSTLSDAVFVPLTFPIPAYNESLTRGGAVVARWAHNP